MNKENFFKTKERIAGRMADIATEHLNGDKVSEELFRETMLLHMVHGVLAKEWEQRLLPWKVENIREHVKEAWNRWNEMGLGNSNYGNLLRTTAMEELRKLIDLIDEG